MQRSGPTSEPFGSLAEPWRAEHAARSGPPFPRRSSDLLRATAGWQRHRQSRAPLAGGRAGGRDGRRRRPAMRARRAAHRLVKSSTMRARPWRSGTLGSQPSAFLTCGRAVIGLW